MLTQIRPTDSFLWGAATSSHQIEGGNTNNDWFAWESQGHTESGEVSGLATDHWNRYKEDLGLAAQLGLNSYRFSVEWSRIEPKRHQFSDSAIEHYLAIILECERLGLKPMLTLHHFTSPLWFTELGGFTNPESPQIFINYVKYVVRKLGSRVAMWCTINEPMVLAVGGYMAGLMPPGEVAPAKIGIVSSNLLASHCLAYQWIHQELDQSESRDGPWRTTPVEVGFAHNLVDFYPDRSWNPVDVALTRAVRNFYNKSWLEAVCGKEQRFFIPKIIPKPPIVQQALGRRTVDYLGINYYTKAYVRVRSPVELSFSKSGEKASDLGWAIHPKGLRRVLKAASKYAIPIYLTENGIADSEDKMRPDFLLSHLGEIAKAIQEGMDIRGYYHWSLLDNFEWTKGFGPRFGLYRVDYSNFKRIKTRSAEIYQKIVLAHHGREVPSRAFFFS